MSIFTTNNPGAQLASIPSKAVLPPQLIPYPTETGSPIIGLPVSVGYGISGGGKTAMEGMLASCAPGLLVVNIDNGYGAAMAAIRILLA